MSLHFDIPGTVTLVTTAETAVASLSFGGPSIPAPGNPGSTNLAPTLIAGVVNVTAGAGTTAVVVRVRQGIGVTGTVVGVLDTDTLAAAASESIAFEKYDATGATSYTVTVQQTGATGNGTVNSASIDVDQNLSGRA